MLLAPAAAAAAPPPVDQPTPTGGNETQETPERPATRSQPTATSVSSQPPARELLSALTDIPQATPPRAVQRQNRQAHRALPETTVTTSVYPAGSDLAAGRFLVDAYAGFFAIQPSTVARISPSQTPTYVPPEGQVLGRIDYRVTLPANTTSPDRRVSWRLQAHDIEDVRLLVDDTTVAATSGTQTPILSYTSLGSREGASHAVALRATISITVERRVTTCTHEVNRTAIAPTLANATTARPATICLAWSEHVQERSEHLTVRASRQVRTYAPSVTGYHARYPDGDTGLAVRADQPIAGLQYEGGHVDAVWRFDTTTATAWATMVRSRANGDERTQLPQQPQHVVAYPSRVGGGPSASATTTIEAVHGPTRTPPSLPAAGARAVVTDPYTATTGLTIRHQADQQPLEAVTLRGLVAGTDVRVHERLRSLTVRRSTLTLTVLERTQDTVLLEVRLREVPSGDPIATIDRPGSIRIGDRRVNTDGDGTVRLTVAHQPTAYTARFVPGPLGTARPALAPATDVVSVRRPSLSASAVLGNLIAPVVSVLAVSFLLDRTTGWNIWPPWAGY